MTENEAIEVLNNFDMQVSAKADGAYQSTIGEMACRIAVKALSEIQRYRAIGTIEECREAIERQKGKKPKSINKVDEDTIYMKCADCGLTTVLYSGMEPDYCPKCGQKLDWSGKKGAIEID